MENFRLNNGIKIPCIGLGTFPMVGEELRLAVKTASSMGYTLFDTASAYRNSEDLNISFKENFKSRDEFFVTTKLSNTDQNRGNVREALKRTLGYLGLEYVDLYLMHWPNPGTYIECYKQMEEVYKEGLTKAIGVCNFKEHHLDNLLANTTIVPAVNQIEMHPLLSQPSLVEYCKDKGILIESYTPFARMDKKLFENKVLQRLAAKYGKKVTQIILRWNYQHGFIAIPKSSNYERQLENINIFDFQIDDEDMLKIDSLNENYRVRYDSDNCDFTKL